MQRRTLHSRIVTRLQRLPAPHATHYGVVPLPPGDALPVSIVGIEDDFLAATAAIARIDALAAGWPEIGAVQRLMSRLEAVQSSRIEGKTGTFEQLVTHEATQAAEAEDATSADADLRQALGYATALDRLAAQARIEGTRALSVASIQDIHRSVMREDPDFRGTPGRFRASVAWIGGTGGIETSTYNPAPPGAVVAGMRDHAEFLGGDVLAFAAPVQTWLAVAHGHFDAVHPFADGNGRVGRMLLPLMLAATGHHPLFLSPYFENNRQLYYDALKAAQQRVQWQPLLREVCRAIVSAAEDLVVVRDRLAGVQADWLVRIRPRRNSALERTLGLILGHPVFGVEWLAREIGVSFAAANGAVAQLVEAGVLRELTGRRRRRLFGATEVLAAVRPPAEE